MGNMPSIQSEAAIKYSHGLPYNHVVNEVVLASYDGATMEGRSKVKVKVKVIILGATVFALSACNRYSAEPIEGWVVDADTKRPIEDVIVVANWQLHKSTAAGKVPAAHLNIMETLTDKYGLFYFDTWGPTFAKWGFFIDRDPALFFYKEGYEYHSVQNPLPSEIDNSRVRRSVWNGATIELKEFEGDLNDLASHLSLLHNSMYTILYGNKCEWKKTPMLVLAIARQEKIFRENNVHNTLTSLDDISGYKCGSAEEYLDRYKK